VGVISRREIAHYRWGFVNLVVDKFEFDIKTRLLIDGWFILELGCGGTVIPFLLSLPLLF
jgi:hypothetical protein